MGLYDVAGLDAKIELPVPLIIDLMPITQVKQRPGYPLWQPPNWIQHETANENVGANALMHSRWLHNGAGGQYVSFHFCVDDHEIRQFIPIDEVTWQAGDGAGPGNYQCISCELCVNSDGDETKARTNAELLAAAVMAAIGRTADNVYRHWDFNYMNSPETRHHCPDHMMTEGYWPTFKANIAARIKALTTPSTPATPVPPPAPEPVYASPVLPDWFTRQDATEHPTDQKYLGRTAYVCKRNYKALAGTVRRSEPTTKAAASGPKVAAGAKVFGIRLWVHPDTKQTWILEETGNWLLASKFSPRVRIDPRTVD